MWRWFEQVRIRRVCRPWAASCCESHEERRAIRRWSHEARGRVSELKHTLTVCKRASLRWWMPALLDTSATVCKSGSNAGSIINHCQRGYWAVIGWLKITDTHTQNTKTGRAFKIKTSKKVVPPFSFLLMITLSFNNKNIKIKYFSLLLSYNKIKCLIIIQNIKCISYFLRTRKKCYLPVITQFKNNSVLFLLWSNQVLNLI